MLFSMIILVLKILKNRPYWVGFCFYSFLSLASKIALTSPANSSKLAPIEATKPSRAIGKAFLMHPIVKVNEQSELAIPMTWQNLMMML